MACRESGTLRTLRDVHPVGRFLRRSTGGDLAEDEVELFFHRASLLPEGVASINISRADFLEVGAEHGAAVPELVALSCKP